MPKDIAIKINILNLAPISNLSKTFNVGTIDTGFFASNGCGKTYISRIFELLATKDNEDYDKFISKNENKCKFEFSVADKENISLNIDRGILPSIPDTYYIYHVFNEDYTEKHYKENYNKNGNIEGVILGKEKKAVEDKIAEIKETKSNQTVLVDSISKKIDAEFQNDLSHIPYLTRLKEYRDWINFDYIKQHYKNDLTATNYNYKKHIDTFQKLSTIPENIQGISFYQQTSDNLKSLLDDQLVKCLHTSYTLAELGDSFRKKIASKEEFIKTGVGLIIDNHCPFCEKPLDNVQDLIHQYNKYIEDTENKIKTYLQEIKNKLTQQTINSDNYSQIYKNFFDYKQKYIPNFNKDLELIDSSEFKKNKQSIINLIDIKLSDIRVSKSADFKELFDSLENINNIVIKNNSVIREFNKILENSNAQKQQTKRIIVKNFYFHLCLNNQKDLNSITNYGNILLRLNMELETLKKEAKTIKKVVGETTKEVIERFFGNKYLFNPNTFRIKFKNSELTGDEPKKVLSQGERSLLTFAYYLGEAHQKIKQDEANYNKLFFIIDDPISSLDFDNVHTVADIIKDIDKMYNMKYKRLFVFTHNYEFLRKLKSNNAISQTFHIDQNGIKKLQGNLSINYFKHLCDIYNTCNGTYSNLHTLGNSIRQVLEGIAKFENPKIEYNITKNYIENNADIKNGVSNTLIQDLSHGNPIAEDSIGDDEWKKVCSNTINHISKKYPKQIEYIVDSINN